MADSTRRATSMPNQHAQMQLRPSQLLGDALDRMEADGLAEQLVADAVFDDIRQQNSGEQPTVQELADWLGTRECPDAAMEETAKRLSDLTGRQFATPVSIVWGRIVAVMIADDGRSGPVELPIARVYELFNESHDDQSRRWPLAPLVAAWRNRPIDIEHEQRDHGRILTGSLAIVGSGDRRAPNLFTPAPTSSKGDQLAFPILHPDTKGPALPLTLYDLGAGSAEEKRSQSAPLALRLFVESILAVPMGNRNRGQPVAMSVSLRELLAWLYPGNRQPRPNEYWPRLMQAIEALDSPQARVPLYDPGAKRTDLRRVVSVTGIPRGAGALDDSVRIIVDLPAGSGNGPQVSDNLRTWGVRSAVAYRLLINLAFHWHEPGRTHYPVGRGKNRHWLQSDNPEHYPPLTDAQLVALAYPISEIRKRSVLHQRAREVVQRLEIAGELRIIQDEAGCQRILPPCYSQ